MLIEDKQCRTDYFRTRVVCWIGAHFLRRSIQLEHAERWEYRSLRPECCGSGLQGLTVMPTSGGLLCKLKAISLSSISARSKQLLPSPAKIYVQYLTHRYASMQVTIGGILGWKRLDSNRPQLF